MAKKKASEPVTEPLPTGTARIDGELLNKARIITAHRTGAGGRPAKLTDYLDAILRGPIEKDYAALMASLRKGD